MLKAEPFLKRDTFKIGGITSHLRVKAIGTEKRGRLCGPLAIDSVTRDWRGGVAVIHITLYIKGGFRTV